MSAATARREVSAAGNDFISIQIGDQRRRPAAFLRNLQRSSHEGLEWVDLASAPAWLRISSAELRGLAHRIALLSMAESLTHSIDGAWLGALSEQAGDQQLEWAIARAGSVPTIDLPVIAASELEPRGYALLAQSLPARLRHLLPGSPHDVASCSRAHIASLLAEAVQQ